MVQIRSTLQNRSGAEKSAALLVALARHSDFASQYPQEKPVIATTNVFLGGGASYRSRACPPIHHTSIKAEIRVGHRIERECCFNTPTPFHAELISKPTAIEEFEYSIRQGSNVVTRHKKSRLSLQD